MEDRGFIIFLICSFEEIKVKIKDLNPDLIIVRRIMENMNGDVIARKLTEIENFQDIPVILFDDEMYSVKKESVLSKSPNIKAYVEIADINEIISNAISLLK